MKIAHELGGVNGVLELAVEYNHMFSNTLIDIIDDLEGKVNIK